MRTVWLVLGGVAIFAVASGVFVTRATPLPETKVAGLTGDPDNGERVFWRTGCASCHAAPQAQGADRLVLSGGQEFPSDFGTFVAPNISPDPKSGIGSWSFQDFASAVQRGVAPDGTHLYPAFPYTAYAKMDLQDVADLKAYMDTLPASSEASLPHDVAFPFNIRRAVGLWKRLYLSDDWVMVNTADPQVEAGRYIVEAQAHCAECHTARDELGGLDAASWMGGAPNPSGNGSIPNITPAKLNWSATDIAYYLESGFTPEFDSAGGHMASVVANFANLPAEDRDAVAAYVKALDPVE
ncbi:cytochrome c [Qingshengfaniella alkalisoli]|uniref:C-type cytochrome n=1 Tax=Qingshengfaniella alkalisoli TaxID=2599296 RepID=A0A5B8J3H7_9RHOB|nr:cytochrome c [Qingshengfaniella alkalisoli]QDY69047.1 c-type cytochrome [Qingshengfaniella alkalisoli]